MSGPEQPSTDPRDHQPPTSGAPARRWLNENVSPAVMEGLRWVTAERPDDPVRALGQFLIDYADGNRRYVPCVYDQVQQDIKREAEKAAQAEQIKREQPDELPVKMEVDADGSGEAAASGGAAASGDASAYASVPASGPGVAPENAPQTVPEIAPESAASVPQENAAPLVETVPATTGPDAAQTVDQNR